MKLCTIATAALMVLGIANIAHAQDSTTIVTPPANSTTEVRQMPEGDTVITVTVNNNAVAFEKNEMPLMVGGRVMVPLRGVVEKLGGNIQYDEASRVISGAQPNLEKQFRLKVGSSNAVVNGKDTTLDAPAREFHGVTYVPLRFVSEALGADVRWDADKHVVTIMADGYTADVKTAVKPVAPTNP